VGHGVLAHDAIFGDGGTARHAGQAIAEHGNQFIAAATEAQRAKVFGSFSSMMQ